MAFLNSKIIFETMIFFLIVKLKKKKLLTTHGKNYHLTNSLIYRLSFKHFFSFNTFFIVSVIYINLFINLKKKCI